MSSRASTPGGIAAVRPQIRRQVRSGALLALSAAILTPCFFGSPEGSGAPASVAPVAAVSPIPTPAPTPDPLELPRPTPTPVPPPQLIVNGDRSQGWVALTFDADMTPYMLYQLRTGQVRSWYDPRIVQTLDAEDVPATFFLTGMWTEAYPDQARSLANDPLIEIGNHSYDHAAFHTPCYKLTPTTDKRAEIEQAQHSIQAITGHTPTLFRFPGDCWSQSDLDLAYSQGLTSVSGDVAGADPFNPSADSVTNMVLAQVQPGSIIILHCMGAPNAPATADALPRIIAGIRARGLHFARVSDLIAAQQDQGRPPAD